MPYITDAGAGNWSDVINQAGDRIRGSAQGLYDEQNKQEEENRALHPIAQALLAKVASGELSPADAAAQAHSQIDAERNPQGQPQQAPPDAQGGGMAAPASTGKLMDYGDSGAPPMARMGSSGPADYTPQTGAQGGGMSQPVTQRDLPGIAAAEKMYTGSVSAKASLIDAKGRNTMANTQAQNFGKQNVADSNNDAKGDRQDKALKEKGRQFDGHLQYMYDALHQRLDEIRMKSRARLQEIETKGASKSMDDGLKEDVGILKDVRSEITKLQNSLVQASSQGTVDEKLAASSKQKIDDLQRQADDLNMSIDYAMKHKGGRKTLQAPPGAQEEVPVEDPWKAGVNGEPATTMRNINGAARQPAAPSLDQHSGGEGSPDTPDIPTSTDVKSPKMLMIKNKKTGQSMPTPADMVEKALAEDPAGFHAGFQIDGVYNAFSGQ